MEAAKLIEAGKELAAQLSIAVGQGAEWLWPILVKQQYVQGFQALLGCSAIAGVLYLIARLLIKDSGKVKAKERRAYEDWEPAATAGWSFLLSIAGTLLLVLGLSLALGRFINPEFYALDYLLSQVSK